MGRGEKGRKCLSPVSPAPGAVGRGWDRPGSTRGRCSRHRHGHGTPLAGLGHEGPPGPTPLAGLAGATARRHSWRGWHGGGHSQGSPLPPPAPYNGMVAITPTPGTRGGLSGVPTRCGMRVQQPLAGRPGSSGSASAPTSPPHSPKKTLAPDREPPCRAGGPRRGLSSPTCAGAALAVEGVGKAPWESGVSHPPQHVLWGLPTASQGSSSLPPGPQRRFLTTTPNPRRGPQLHPSADAPRMQPWLGT